MSAPDKWFAMPAAERECVLSNMRCDYENWRDQDPSGDEYPGEGRIRAACTALAIEALGGSVEWWAS